MSLKLLKTSPEAHPSRASVFSRFEKVSEHLRFEKRSSNDADDLAPCTSIINIIGARFSMKGFGVGGLACVARSWAQPVKVK